MEDVPRITESPKRDWFNDYFAFRLMVSPWIFKVGYAVVAAAISLLGMYSFWRGLAEDGDWWRGVVVFFGGNLIWRIICEAGILFFSIHEALASIERKLRQDDSR